MPAGRLGKALAHVRKTLLLQDCAEMTDGQLLECFIKERQDTAIEAIMHRHGAMVLGVCRRVVGNLQDAEDAFQATFIVLVRKAPSIVPREMVGNWLYGVAYRTALKARKINARRQCRERQAEKMPHPQTKSKEIWDDLQPVLDQELSRLPGKYRSPILLCDMEGSITEGIYKLEGDALTWCMRIRKEMGTRPVEFRAPKNSRCVVYSFVRLKK